LAGAKNYHAEDPRLAGAILLRDYLDGKPASPCRDTTGKHDGDRNEHEAHAWPRPPLWRWRRRRWRRRNAPPRWRRKRGYPAEPKPCFRQQRAGHPGTRNRPTAVREISATGTRCDQRR